MAEPSLAQIFVGFVATLIATLIGVERGFEKDRQAERKQTRNRTVQHLESISSEISLNRSIAVGNYNLVDQLQANESVEAEHYTLEMFRTDAWDSAIEDQIIEVADPEFYRELQDLYNGIKSTNELIRRLRTESLHSRIGDEVEYGNTEFPIWTIDVHYWDENSEDIEVAGLGELIRDRSNQVNIQSSGVLDRIEPEIERIKQIDSKEPIVGFNRQAAQNYVNAQEGP